ncbi:hypothetical protein LEMLEM_LOCUS206, partial [Lemmus lemmus]
WSWLQPTCPACDLQVALPDWRNWKANSLLDWRTDQWSSEVGDEGPTAALRDRFPWRPRQCPEAL